MKKIKEILPENIYSKLVEYYNNYILDYSTKTYSQEGEDLILKKIFYGKENGFYIDIGACLLYTSPSPRDRTRSRMPSSACKKITTKE